MRDGSFAVTLPGRAYARHDSISLAWWRNWLGVQNGDSLELRLERINRRGNLALKNLERFHDWSLPIWKRYIDEVLEVYVDFCITDTNGPARIVIKTSDSSLGNRAPLDQTSTKDGQLSMFVWVGNIVEGFRPCASTIRLEVLDKDDVVMTQPPQLLQGILAEKVTTVGRSPIFGVLDGELSSLLLTPGILPREFVDEVIEGGPKIVDRLPNHDSCVEGNIHKSATREAQIAALAHLEMQSIHLLLGNDCILCRFPEAFNNACQLANMSIRPIDPSECTIERMHHDSKG